MKLLMMLVAFMVVAMALVGLRHHRLEIMSQSAGIYDEIQDRRQTLLDQRVEIGRKTNPWALAAALQDSGVGTGEAMRLRSTQPKALVVPKVETDLIAPLLENAGIGGVGGTGGGHVNPNRPRG